MSRVSANENWQEMFSFLYCFHSRMLLIPTCDDHGWRKKPPAIASHSIEVIIKSRIDSSLNELLQIMREFFYGSTFCMLTNAREPFFIPFDIIFILPRANQTLLSCALAEDFNCLLWKISAVMCYHTIAIELSAAIFILLRTSRYIYTCMYIHTNSHSPL